MKTTGFNFTEACEKLFNGNCKRIKSVVSNNEYENKNCKITGTFDRQPDLIEILDEWMLIEPKLVYEEVEVKQYIWIKQNGSKELHGYPIEPPPASGDLVEMRGTIKREVKSKVKHRELIYETDDNGYPSKGACLLKPNAKIWMEWEFEEE